MVKKYKNANRVGWKKGWEKSENDNRVYSFIWHLRVPTQKLTHVYCTAK